MLEYHGLAGRHRITPPALTRWSKTLIQARSRQPLMAELAAEASRRTRLDEDHLARMRVSATLGLAAPAPVAAGAALSVAAGPSQANQAIAATAVRAMRGKSEHFTHGNDD